MIRAATRLQLRRRLYEPGDELLGDEGDLAKLVAEGLAYAGGPASSPVSDGPPPPHSGGAVKGGQKRPRKAPDASA